MGVSGCDFKYILFLFINYIFIVYLFDITNFYSFSIILVKLKIF
jgi:hypothetical protein